MKKKEGSSHLLTLLLHSTEGSSHWCLPRPRAWPGRWRAGCGWPPWLHRPSLAESLSGCGWPPWMYRRAATRRSPWRRCRLEWSRPRGEGRGRGGDARRSRGSQLWALAAWSGGVEWSDGVGALAAAVERASVGRIRVWPYAIAICERPFTVRVRVAC